MKIEIDVNTRKFKRQESEQVEKMKIVEKLWKTGDIKMQSKAQRMNDCCSNILLKVCPNCLNHTISSEQLCRERLCPTCARISASEHFVETMKCIEIAETKHMFCVLFLTLTIRNVKVESLRAGMQILSKGFTRLMRCLNKSVKGYARSIEITYNEGDNTYHPHIHSLLLCEQSTYIPHTELIKKWRKATQADYDPSVRINRVDVSKSERVAAACAECCKYALKSSDIAVKTDSIEILSEQLRNVRTYSTGGILKEQRAAARQSIKAGKTETRECRKCGELIEVVRGEWNGSGYSF